MIDKLKEKLGEGVLENESLVSHCTFKIGGPARYFFVAKSAKEVRRAVETANELGLNFFVFSGGSNILFSDNGFDGLVVKVDSSKLAVYKTNCRIVADSGVLLSKIVEAAAENGLPGLEWAAGIPGRAGGAVRGNAGAYGKATGDAVEEVEALRLVSHKLRIKNYGKKECGFGYRDSIFKREGGIILKVVLKLEKGDKEKIKEEMKKIFKARGEKIPTEPSAGSFFKNIEITDEIIKSFQSHFKEDIPADFIQKGKIPSAWLIEKCELKDRKIGGAKISEKHANFIVNTGKATADNVIALASLVKMEVRNKTGIQLQEEVEYVGF